MWILFRCPQCGHRTLTPWGTVTHCDPIEPIDDIDDDGPGIIRGSD